MGSIGSILEYLQSGETIAYPTEGVWGLGCDPSNTDAIKKLLGEENNLKSDNMLYVIMILSHLQHFYQQDFFQPLKFFQHEITETISLSPDMFYIFRYNH